MHLQVLSSGSGGNATLVRSGETAILVDAGLPLKDLDQRFAAAGFASSKLDHVLVTHGHLDHARSAGVLARRERSLLHTAAALQSNASIRRCKNLNTLCVGSTVALPGRAGDDGLRATSIPLPHDALPTVAFKIEDGQRCAVILTDMGMPRADVASALRGAHVLVLEFNHDAQLLRDGAYSPALKRRILGNAGHLSNDQAAAMLELLATDALHTLVLAHLSAHNNTRALALECAVNALARCGMSHVRVLIADQDCVGENLEV
ncbi:MAG TPA: MBL fold metallo-hydrolase [Planctomycetota bacterium]|nr:MBL fold metallo-hydrolase [Planctomycetota bacterium]